MANIGVALQLYTVRDQLRDDFAGTLKAVAQMGYPAVELAGYGGRSAKELKQLLDDLGLRVAGDHVGIDRLEQDLGAVIDTSMELSNRYVVCPFVPESRRRDEAGWRQLATTLSTIGQKCGERGVQLCYHNHAFEFEPVDGTNGFELLFANSNPRYVQMELDVFWAKKGGDDPPAIMSRYPGRCPIVHLKDMTADQQQTFAEVGEGTMDFQSIFRAAPTGGASWYVVEQDRCSRPPLESAQLSLRHLREWGIA